MNNSTIAILLATYNSEKHLRAQIDSLLEQDDADWKLFLRDDGSTDNTLNIIAEYTGKYVNIIFLDDDQSGLRPLKSFMKLLELTDAQYYMFCDHDDVWKKNKISLSRKVIYEHEELHPEMPVVIHSDLNVVDENLNMLHESFWKYSRIYPSKIEKSRLINVFNCVTGCTMIFNSAAKNISFPYPESAPMHDWWVATQVFKNGIIGHIDEPLILYRQHTKNEVGARNVDNNYFINKIRGFKQTIRNNREHLSYVRKYGGLSVIQFLYYKTTYTFLRIIS